MGGYDLGVSLSASDSTSQGIQDDFRGVFGGDFIVGRGAAKGLQLPPWFFLAVIGVGALLGTLWFIRR